MTDATTTKAEPMAEDQPVLPSVRAYLEKEVVPALMPVLTEMTRTRPADPLEWLATRLRAAADAAKAAPKVEEGA